MTDPDDIILALLRREWLAMGMPVLYTDDGNGGQVPERLPTQLSTNADGRPRRRRWDRGKKRKWVVRPTKKRKAA
jgi:hypothetical protein